MTALDSLKDNRDNKIRELWIIFREMSDMIEPDEFTYEDLSMWEACTKHSAVQDRLKTGNEHQREDYNA